MKFRDLIEQLENGTIVPMGHEQWSQVAGQFPLVEDIDTHMSGTDSPDPPTGGTGKEAGLGHRRGSGPGNEKWSGH